MYRQLIAALLVVTSFFGAIQSLFADEGPLFPALQGLGGYSFDEEPVAAANVPQARPVETPAPRSLFGGTTQPTWFGRSSPVRVAVHGGENYAEPTSFISLGMLHPLHSWQFQSGSEQITYLDVRLGFDADGGKVANVGYGRRHYFATDNTIVDANIWYDADSASGRVFHQFAVGGQIQNENLLFRSHFYLPFAETEDVTGYTPLTGNFTYRGNVLALERYRIEQQAYRGFDAEVGVMLPLGEQMLKTYLGYYNFQASDAEDVTGISGTISFNVFEKLWLSFQANYDDESQAGYMITAAYDFYHGPTDPAADIRHRLGETSRRNYHIVSRQTRIYDPESATDADGNVYNFIHVSTAGNSNGTIESPYGNLADAQTAANATAKSIIIAHADSVFDAQGITLPAETRFLGEGVNHTLTTPAEQLGDIILPAAGGGTALPIIRNAPGAAITLGANSEVNGFGIETPTTAGLFASSLANGATIANTTVTGGATGVHILDSGGTFTFDGLSISNTTGSGLHIERANSGAAITFNNATAISNAGQYGIHLERNLTGSTVTFAGTTNVSNTTNHGIFFDDNADTAAVSFDAATTVDTTGGSGVFVSNLDSGTISSTTNINFANNLTISNSSQAGLATSLNDSNVSIQTLAITNWTTNAIAVTGSTGDLTVVNPITLNNVNGSLLSTIDISNNEGAVTFSDVTIVDTVRGVGGVATVNLFQNDTGVDEITFNALNITTQNGIALQARDSGSNNSKLVIRSGNISTTGASAVWLDTLATDVTLQSVSASNTAIGINLINVGQSSAFHRKFQVVGDSTTAGSGGTISNVQQGVVVNGSEDVFLHLMNIDSSVAGVSVGSNGFNQPENFTANKLQLTNTGNNANWVGVDVNWGSGGHFGDANVLTNNTITSSGAGQTGLRVANNRSSTEMDLTIGGNTINLAGAGSAGISLSANGAFAGQTTNIGGISLTTDLNNIVNAPSPFVTSQTNGATINGQVLVNGILVP